MRKQVLVLALLVCAALSYAGSYGILVNGQIYFAAEYRGKDGMTGTYD